MTNRKYNGASKEERQKERFDKLVQAGIYVIGTEGYQATTVKKVCQHAGLTERYFYESFKNKEALLSESYKLILSELKADIIKNTDITIFDPSSASKKGIEVYFTHMKDNPAAARLIMLEVLGVSDHVDQLYRTAMADINGILMTIAKPFYDSLDTPWDGDIVISGLTGAAIQIARQWVLDNYEQPIEIMVESCFVLFEATVAHFKKLL